MSSVSLKEGMVQFRHALVRDGLYGKPIRKGVGKLADSIQKQIAVDLEKLQEAKEPIRSKAAEELKVCKPALDIWYEPLEEEQRAKEWDAKKQQDDEATVKRVHGEMQERKELAALSRRMEEQYDGPLPDPFDWDPKLSSFVDFLISKIRRLENTINEKDALLIQKDNEITGLVSKTGQVIEGQKALTLRACYDHFKVNVISKGSARTKNDLFRRVETVLDILKWETPHSEINMRKIIEACKTDNINEQKYRLRDVKRFFTLLSYPPPANGLGLPNPAASIKPGQPVAGEIEILDPKPVLKLESLDLYWRAMTAVMGFAGLRLVEVAALEWNMIDSKAKLLKLRKTNVYNFKNAQSERDIRPFTQLWPILEQYKKRATHERIVFPRPLTGAETVNKGNESWLEMRDESPAAINLSGAFKDALEATGEPYPEPAKRLRKYWETQMRKKGHTDLIVSMGGHSEETGAKFYAKHAEIVKAAKIGRA